MLLAVYCSSSMEIKRACSHFKILDVNGAYWSRKLQLTLTLKSFNAVKNISLEIQQEKIFIIYIARILYRKRWK